MQRGETFPWSKNGRVFAVSLCRSPETDLSTDFARPIVSVAAGVAQLVERQLPKLKIKAELCASQRLRRASSACTVFAPFAETFMHPLRSSPDKSLVVALLILTYVFSASCQTSKKPAARPQPSAEELAAVKARTNAAIAEVEARRAWDADAPNRRRREFIEKNPGLSETEKDRILGGYYWVGASASAIRASLGDPRRVHASSNGYEMWVYGRDLANSTYIHFERGVVVSWDTTR